MPIGVSEFPILSFEQSNPYLTGLQKTLDINNQFVKNMYEPQSLQAQLDLVLSQAKKGQIENEYLPQGLQQDVLRQHLANQLSQATLPYAGPKAAAEVSKLQAEAPLERAQAGYYGAQTSAMPSEIALRLAQAQQARALAAQEQFKAQNPLFMAGGPSAQLGAYQYAMQKYPQLFGGQGVAQEQMPQAALGGHPQAYIPSVGGAYQGGQATSSPLAQAFLNNVIGQMNLPGAKAALYQQKVSGAGYLDAPIDSKRYMAAQATAFGYTPDEAVKQLIGGKTIADLADAKGFGRNPTTYPTPDYFPTVGTLSRNQMRSAAVSELNSVEPFITEATAPYAQRFGGYSIKQILDTAGTEFKDLKPSDPQFDKSAKLLGAKIIIPEYNVLRLRAMGANNIGVEAMRDIGKASMNEFKTLESQLSPDLYAAANKYATQHINLMNKAALKANLVPFQEQTNQVTAQQRAISGGLESAPQMNTSNPGFVGAVKNALSPKGGISSSNTVKVMDSKGTIWEIPREKAKEAIARGGRMVNG